MQSQNHARIDKAIGAEKQALKTPFPSSLSDMVRGLVDTFCKKRAESEQRKTPRRLQPSGVVKTHQKRLGTPKDAIRILPARPVC
jgi:hypothetical protein